MLASCSNEPFVLIWTPDSDQPFLNINKITSPVITIKWSNATQPADTSANGDKSAGGAPTADSLLAIGSQDGLIQIWNIRLNQMIVKLDS